jgi:hypothetical protein
MSSYLNLLFVRCLKLNSCHLSSFYHHKFRMADRDLRKVELERKKAKLAEMRKEKQRKEVNEKLASKKAN